MVDNHSGEIIQATACTTHNNLALKFLSQFFNLHWNILCQKDFLKGIQTCQVHLKEIQ